MTHPASCGVLMPEPGADGLILVQHTNTGGEEMRHFLTSAGSFKVPAGVSSIWVELIGGGAKGGEDGEYVAELLGVRPGQSIVYAVGAAGETGSDAEDTVFGPFRARGGRRLVPADTAATSSLGWLQRLD